MCFYTINVLKIGHFIESTWLRVCLCMGTRKTPAGRVTGRRWRLLGCGTGCAVCEGLLLHEVFLAALNVESMCGLLMQAATIEVAMSTYLVQVEAQSVAKQAGTVARKTRRTRTSDSVVGFMQQRPSRLRDIFQQRGKDMVFDVLPPS